MQKVLNIELQVIKFKKVQIRDNNDFNLNISFQ